MRFDRKVAWTVAVGTGALIALLAMTLWLPAYITFAIVITIATLWCWWLERHPT